MAADQIAARGRNDDGTETTATWKAAQNTNWTQQVDTNFRVRFRVQNAASVLNNLTVRLQYSLNGGTFTNVDASSSVVRSSASANLADAANLTTQLTGGSGTFIGATAFDEVDGLCGGSALDVTSTGIFEVEYCCQLRSADVNNGDTIRLRTLNGSGSAWGSYTYAGPDMTAAESVSETTGLGSLGAGGIAPTMQILAPKGTFAHTDLNAAFWPSRPYGSFAGKSGGAASETPSLASLTLTGIASTINVQQPKGAFSHTYVNAAFLPSRRYGLFAGKGGALVNYPITPARGSLGVTGIASSLLQGTVIVSAAGTMLFSGIASPLSRGTIIIPPMGAITIAGFAPVVAQGMILTTSLGSAGFTGISSTLRQENIIRGPPVAALAMTGTIPIVLQGALISPQQGLIGTTGLAPTELLNYFLTSSTANLAATGLVPNILIAGAGIFIIPGGASGALSSTASAVKIESFLTVPSGSLTASGIASSLSRSISPTLGSLSIAGLAPAAVQGFGIVPTVGSGLFGGIASTVKFELFLTVPAGSLNASGVAAGLSRSITPSTGNLTATGIASSTVQAAIIYPAAGSSTFTTNIPSLLLGSVGLPPQALLGASGFGPLIQLVTFVPSGSLSITGNNIGVTSGTIQIQKTQLGARFIPAKRYKLQGFANKFGTQQTLIAAGALTLSGFTPTIIKSYVPTLAPVALTGFVPSINISTLGDRFVTPPAGSLTATGRVPSVIRGSTKKTQLTSRFIPGRRYGNFGFKAGINITVNPSCGGAIRIYYLVDGSGNYIVDENGNYVLSYADQPGTTAVFNSFLPKVQVSLLAGITISPTRGSLSVISFAPSVRVDLFITPAKGDLAAVGNAPISSTGIILKPTTGSLSISGAAPNSGISYAITPARGSLQATGTLSTVFIGAGAGLIEAPSNGTLSATGFQPITKTAAFIGQGQISIGGFAPIVSRATVIVPPRAQVFALGQFSVPSRSTIITPPAGSLSQSSAVPIQSIVTGVPAAQLGLAGYAPFVTTETGLRVAGASLAASGFTPAQIVTSVMPAGQASLIGYPPQIPKLFIPATGQIGFTGFSSLFKQPEVILIDLKGKAVTGLTLTGKLINKAEAGLSGKAVSVVVIKKTGT